MSQSHDLMPPAYMELFQHMSQEHDLCLTNSEMEDIIDIVQDIILRKEHESGKRWVNVYGTSSSPIAKALCEVVGSPTFIMSDIRMNIQSNEDGQVTSIE